MRHICLSLAIAAITCVAIPAHAQTKRWTNADMDTLRARRGISIVGQEAPPVSAEAIAPAEAPAGPVYVSRLQDPAWYAELSADLQAELYARIVALSQAQRSLADASNGRGITGSF